MKKAIGSSPKNTKPGEKGGTVKVSGELWRCQKCFAQFAVRNQSHSCGHYSIDGFLEGKPQRLVQLYNDFIREYRKIGEFTLHPVKTRIALLSKVRFASINKIGNDCLTGHLVLTRRADKKSLFFKIDNLENRFFVHHFRLHSIDEIDKTFVECMREAYDYGERKHLKRKKLA